MASAGPGLTLALRGALQRGADEAAAAAADDGSAASGGGEGGRRLEAAASVLLDALHAVPRGSGSTSEDGGDKD